MLNIRRCVVVTVACMILAACFDSDGRKRETLNEFYISEARCVIAAERLNLFKEAARHFDHMRSERDFQTSTTHKETSLAPFMAAARYVGMGQSAQRAASYLSEFCNRDITVGEVRDAE